jgi:hypothetical protein
MLPPLSVPHPLPLTLLLLLDAPPDRAWAEGLHALSAALPDAEPLVRGHGPPDSLAPALRALAAGPVPLRVELGTRAQGRSAALVAGVRAARTPWVLWLPRPDAGVADRAQVLRRRAETAGPGTCFHDGSGACLFRRDALLQLPRIPGMHRLLPELFARDAAAPAMAGPGRLRRAYVAFACTMGLGWTPARRIA